MQRRPTSFDIAALAGVSQPTVSRALNSSPSVSDETRARVLAAAEQLNYKVDKNASGLRRSRSRTLALLFEEATADGGADQPLLSVDARRDGPQLRGCAATICSFRSSSSRPTGMSIMPTRHKADGIILLGYGDYFESEPQLSASSSAARISCAGVRRAARSSARPSAPTMSRAGSTRPSICFRAAAAASRFIGTAEPGYPEFHDRWRGYCRALRAAGIEPDDTSVHRCRTERAVRPRSGRGIARARRRFRRRLRRKRCRRDRRDARASKYRPGDPGRSRDRRLRRHSGRQPVQPASQHRPPGSPRRAKRWSSRYRGGRVWRTPEPAAAGPSDRSGFERRRDRFYAARDDRDRALSAVGVRASAHAPGGHGCRRAALAGTSTLIPHASGEAQKARAAPRASGSSIGASTSAMPRTSRATSASAATSGRSPRPGRGRRSDAEVRRFRLGRGRGAARLGRRAPFAPPTAPPPKDRADSMAAHGYKAIGRDFPENSIGWYRAPIAVTSGDRGRRLWLEFDGVFRDAIVFVNGYVVGRNESGYAPFRVEIDDFLDYDGGPNVITVRVDATLGEGWFYEGAGIYRHVELVRADPRPYPAMGDVCPNRDQGRRRACGIDRYPERATQPVAVLRDSRWSAPKRMVRYATSQAQPRRRGAAHAVDSMLLRRSAALVTSTPRHSTPGHESWSAADGRRPVRDALRDPRPSASTPKRLLPQRQAGEVQGTCNHQDHAGVGSACPTRCIAGGSRAQGDGLERLPRAHNPPATELLDACDRWACW